LGLVLVNFFMPMYWDLSISGKYFITRFMFGLTKKFNFIDLKKLKLRRGWNLKLKKISSLFYLLTSRTDPHNQEKIFFFRALNFSFLIWSFHIDFFRIWLDCLFLLPRYEVFRVSRGNYSARLILSFVKKIKIILM
jgi:hypothetical protein